MTSADVPDPDLEFGAPECENCHFPMRPVYRGWKCPSCGAERLTQSR